MILNRFMKCLMEKSVLGSGKEHCQVEIRECSFDDIVEIDTFRELKQIDKTYDI